MTLQKIGAWLTSLLRDPNDQSVSSARLCAVLCVLTAIYVAIAGLYLGRDESATVVALLGGGAANLFARTRSTPGAS